jgi:uncharacterized protein with GYD domain
MKMPKYIVLGKFTSQGIMNIKDSPKRLKNADKAIVEAPDENEMTLSLLAIGSQGNVSTETLTAIPSDKATEIIGKIP